MARHWHQVGENGEAVVAVLAPAVVVGVADQVRNPVHKSFQKRTSFLIEASTGIAYNMDTIWSCTSHHIRNTTHSGLFL